MELFNYVRPKFAYIQDLGLRGAFRNTLPLIIQVYWQNPPHMVRVDTYN